MKTESKKHIGVVADNFIKALQSCSKGSYFYERKDGESMISIPMPNPSRVKFEIVEQLEKLCRNFARIEYAE